MSGFYYIDNGEKFGPFELDEFRDFHLPAETLVWKQGLTEWIPADQLEEIKDQFEAEPPPIPESVPPKIPTEKSQAQKTPTKKAAKTAPKGKKKVVPKENPIKKFFRLLFGLVFFLVGILCIIVPFAEDSNIESEEEKWFAIILGVIFTAIGILIFRAKPKARYYNDDGTLTGLTMGMMHEQIVDDYGDYGGDF